MSTQIHTAEVVSTRRLTPGMIRVTLGGADLATFRSTGVPDEYIRIFFPEGPDRRQVNAPVPAGRGWEFPEGVTPAPMRTYTVRAWRPDAAELDVDFVVHSHGVAADWVRAAEPGDVVALNSPNGLYEPPADLAWQLLVTDQTGLPAVARLLEQNPPNVRTKVVIEVPGDDHRQPLPAVNDVEVTWIHGGNGTGPSQLHEVVKSTPAPEGAQGYIWVAGETRCLRDIRKHLRHTLQLSAANYKVIGYWTHNADEWRDRYQSLPEEVRQGLIALWDEDRDREEIEDTYVEQLERLGL